MDSWQIFRKTHIWDEGCGFGIDGSKIRSPRREDEESRAKVALAAMAALEAGEIANGDENRRVGHYWLRNPEIAPTEAIRRAICESRDRVLSFAQQVGEGRITVAGERVRQVLSIGIGGSSLGPQLLCDALGDVERPIFFLDNTDPDGFRRIWKKLLPKLDRTLVLVTSKSGSTPEPKNAMVETAQFFADQGLDFPSRAVAITQEDSQLDRLAIGQGWLARFPMWDWIGGRTSITSAVGLLPAALAGVDVKEFLAGARMMDELTRRPEQNPALALAEYWYRATDGNGAKTMIILPYCDGLRFLGAYLQQLIMESLGKEKDRDGNVVHQGLTVFGNRGSTDQHSYVQQLRDGLNNFFVTFVEVLRHGPSLEVAAGRTSADYLECFLLGTRKALAEKNRESITITLRELSARSLGLLVALYERAVGFYATWIRVNAYNQPGVEAGKRAAEDILQLKNKIERYLSSTGTRASQMEVGRLAAALDIDDEENNWEMVGKMLEYLRANGK